MTRRASSAGARRLDSCMPENIALWGSLGFLAGLITALAINGGTPADKPLPAPRSTVVECQPL